MHHFTFTTTSAVCRGYCARDRSNWDLYKSKLFLDWQDDKLVGTFRTCLIRKLMRIEARRKSDGVSLMSGGLLSKSVPLVFYMETYGQHWLVLTRLCLRTLITDTSDVPRPKTPKFGVGQTSNTGGAMSVVKET